MPPRNILGLGGVRVPILFGNDFLWNDLPYSKGLMNFGFLEPSNIMFDFWFFLVERHLAQFVRVPPNEIWAFLTNFIFYAKTRQLYREKSGQPFSKIIFGKSKVFFSARSYVYLHCYTPTRDRGAQCAPTVSLGLSIVWYRIDFDENPHKEWDLNSSPTLAVG